VRPGPDWWWYTAQGTGRWADWLTWPAEPGRRSSTSRRPRRSIPGSARGRLDWAAALRRRATGSDLAQARVLARQAAAEARRLDMPGPAERAERLAGELEQAIAAANPLTRREREIAELVSDGLTNRAIADRLVLSERTVEGHVRSTLAKLQLNNRTELAAWALRDTDS